MWFRYSILGSASVGVLIFRRTFQNVPESSIKQTESVKFSMEAM